MAVKSTVTDQKTIASKRSSIAPPPLESGDRLTRREFERRYNAMPYLRKAELIVEIAVSSAAYDMHDKMRDDATPPSVR